MSSPKPEVMQRTALIVGPIFRNSPLSMCGFSLSSSHYRYLRRISVNKNTNMAIQFESKHGLKLINFPRRAYVLRLSADKYFNVHTPRNRVDKAGYQNASESIFTCNRVEKTGDWNASKSIFTHNRVDKLGNQSQLAYIISDFAVRTNSCFAHTFVARVLIYRIISLTNFTAQFFIH